MCWSSSHSYGRFPNWPSLCSVSLLHQSCRVQRDPVASSRGGVAKPYRSNQCTQRGICGPFVDANRVKRSRVCGVAAFDNDDLPKWEVGRSARAVATRIGVNDFPPPRRGGKVPDDDT
ncbi:predicted protein [Plenodomus lingam JN3]|uniref:Predicted protein n=1 Tax=Leptosphaeria maculans (strain JN3 / isolate v23.1.3 / race Av1-4-5-6-7-8) TaxID=985895 RepID=E5R5D5_LEPMJ|nr:predicted protein [Plenodomus lingam JN3]CBX92105.1 predicted protein [Plenodomus lingam JN3]